MFFDICWNTSRHEDQQATALLATTANNLNFKTVWSISIWKENKASRPCQRQGCNSLSVCLIQLSYIDPHSTTDSLRQQTCSENVICDGSSCFMMCNKDYSLSVLKQWFQTRIRNLYNFAMAPGLSNKQLWTKHLSKLIRNLYRCKDIQTAGCWARHLQISDWIWIGGWKLPFARPKNVKIRFFVIKKMKKRGGKKKRPQLARRQKNSSQQHLELWDCLYTTTRVVLRQLEHHHASIFHFFHGINRVAAKMHQ